jgi:hypothetical protein
MEKAESYIAQAIALNQFPLYSEGFGTYKQQIEDLKNKCLAEITMLRNHYK